MIEFTPPFLLIRDNGQTLVFETLSDLAVAAAASRISINNYHVIQSTQWWLGGRASTTVERAEWIVRDDRGRRVSSAEVWNAKPGNDYASYKQRRNKAGRHAEKLGLPIPGTGKRHPYRNYLRAPHHLAAHRESAQCDRSMREARLPGRVKRPPTLWDDIIRSDYNNFSWKRHRKTQWKE